MFLTYDGMVIGLEQAVSETPLPRDSVVVKGPMDLDFLLVLFGGCRDFYLAARDFEKQHTGTKALVWCQFPEDRRQAICAFHEDSPYYTVNVRGTLGKYGKFMLSLGRERSYRVSGFENDFLVLTKGISKGDIYVHINGPDSNPVISNLLALRKSIHDYCLG